MGGGSSKPKPQASPPPKSQSPPLDDKQPTSSKPDNEANGINAANEDNSPKSEPAQSNSLPVPKEAHDANSAITGNVSQPTSDSPIRKSPSPSPPHKIPAKSPSPASQSCSPAPRDPSRSPAPRDPSRSPAPRDPSRSPAPRDPSRSPAPRDPSRSPAPRTNKSTDQEASDDTTGGLSRSGSLSFLDDVLNVTSDVPDAPPHPHPHSQAIVPKFGEGFPCGGEDAVRDVDVDFGYSPEPYGNDPGQYDTCYDFADMPSQPPLDTRFVDANGGGGVYPLPSQQYQHYSARTGADQSGASEARSSCHSPYPIDCEGLRHINSADEAIMQSILEELEPS